VGEVDNPVICAAGLKLSDEEFGVDLFAKPKNYTHTNARARDCGKFVSRALFTLLCGLPYTITEFRSPLRNFNSRHRMCPVVSTCAVWSSVSNFAYTVGTSSSVDAF